MTEYLSTPNNIKDKVKRKLRVVEENKKPTDVFHILTMNEYELVKTNNYKINELKEICRFYKLKKSGNKKELIERIYHHLKYSSYIVKIQKIIRGNFMRKYIQNAGPAFKMIQRGTCVNDTDFATLEPIVDIPYNQFFSFLDNNGNVYGCDVISFYSLIHNRTKYDIYRNKEIVNPYNRKPIDEDILDKFSQNLCLARINRIEQVTITEDEMIDPKKQLELKILGLFQYINELGNYADSSWFMNLSRFMIIVFIREMYDIWHYRAQLTPTMMRDIVPPHGNPFIDMNFQAVQGQNEEQVRRQAVKIMEYLVKSSNTTDNRSLGAYYILAALTLVSDDARNALPWLYQSVAQ
jgi:hypothetical protein